MDEIKVVKVEVDNRKAKLLSPYYIDDLMPFWSYSDPKYLFKIRRFPNWGWDGRVKFLSRDKLPSGLFWATRKEIEKELGIQFKVKPNLTSVELSPKEDWILASGKYQFQNDCVQEMVKVLRFGGGLIVNATGSGKTYLCAQFFSRLKNMACFVVDQLMLLEQAKRDMEKVLGEEVGWVGKSEFQPRRITVATRQTMYRHKDDPRFQLWTKGLGVMVIDELHEQMNHSNFSILEEIKPTARYGLTATIALNKKSVKVRAHAICGPVIYSYPLERGQREGVLSRGVGVRIMYQNVLKRREMKALKWAKLYQDVIEDNNERNFLIEDLTRALHDKGKYVIVLVTRIRHLSLLSKRLEDIPHRVVSGTFRGESVSVSERFQAKKNFERGQIRLILANTVFKKGVDIKRVDAIIDGSGGRSENDAVQKYGRGIRLHDEKEGLLYFDVNDWDQNNTDNWFWKGARYRTRALKRNNVPMYKFVWGEDGEGQELVKVSEQWLKQQLKGEV